MFGGLYSEICRGRLTPQSKDLDRERREALRRFSDYMLCKEFGWTILELMNQPNEDIDHFLAIMNAIARHNESEAKAARMRNR